MAMGLTPMRRSYSSLTVLGEDATFSKNVRTGVFGYAERSSSRILMSSFGWNLEGSGILQALPLLVQEGVALARAAATDEDAVDGSPSHDASHHLGVDELHFAHVDHLVDRGVGHLHYVRVVVRG